MANKDPHEKMELGIIKACEIVAKWKLTDKTAAHGCQDGEQQKEEVVIVGEEKADQLNPWQLYKSTTIIKLFHRQLNAD